MADKEVYIKISNGNALAWIHKLVQNTLANRTHQTTITFYEELSALDEAFSNPLMLEDIQQLPLPEPKARKTRSDAGQKRKRKKKPGLSREDKANPLICNDHPKYQGVRRPQSDCDGCWSVYKALHPMEYEIKRRDFLRSKRAASAEG